MRVCTVTHSYLPTVGGAELALHDLLRAVAHASGAELSVVTPTTTPLPSREVRDGIEIIRYPRPDRWARWWVPTVTSWPVLSRVRDLRPDLVHAFYILPTGLAAWAAARQSQTPLVVTLVGADMHDPFSAAPRVLQFLARRVLRRSDRLVATSNYVADVTAATRGLARPEVVPLPVDTGRFHPHEDGSAIRRRFRIPTDACVLFALQRLERRKGTEVLVAAMELIRQQQDDVYLLLGGAGRTADQLADLVATSRAADRITLCGFVPEAEKLSFYAAADIFVLHSHHEGLGMVLAEAAAAGVPAVSAAAGGTVDVVRHGESGLLVEPGNPVVLAHSILELVRDPERRTKFSSAARAHAETTFGMHVVGRRYAEMFRSTAEGMTPSH